MQTNNDFRDERYSGERRSLWDTAAILFQRRKLLVAIPFGVAVITAIITLLVSNYYRASSTVLLPEGGGGSLSAALMGNLPSAASSLLGSGGGDYVRYMAILQSRSVLESAVDSFNLVQVYDLSEEDHPRPAAVSMLRDNTEAVLDKEFDVLEVSVVDLDPERAASIANFFVRRLNEMNSRLASQNAANYRRYIEQRYFDARAAMDSVLNATTEFQRKHGVFDLPTQAEGFFQHVADLRARALEAEIQHEALLAQYGPDNPQVQGFAEIAKSANRKYMNALQGQERLLPVPQDEVPQVGRQYVDLELERTIQQRILEVIGPMYEEARLQEEKESQAVQVLDEAIPPVEKAGPKRTLIVLASAFSALILTVIYILALAWWRRSYYHVAERLGAKDRRVETST